MFRYFKLVMLMILIIPVIIYADEPDIFVGEVELSGTQWGEQNAVIELTNKTEHIKYVVAETEINFEGIYLNPNFKTKSNITLQPEETVTFEPEFFIPGNYGKAKLELRLYDVVDSRDELMSWQIFYEQPFMLKFNAIDAVLPYLQEKITLPPRTDIHPYFTNEFSRILFVLLAEGKTVDEIAKMNKCDVSFVEHQIKRFVDNKYLRKKDSVFTPSFPVISLKEAEAARPIAEKYADSLAIILGANMKNYQVVLDSMIAVKAIPNDSNDFVSGASLLFKPTPIVSAMVLWYELGRKFITRAAPLLIYDGTDICNAGNVQYMYAVVGGDHFNGSHFFGLFYGTKTYSMMFAHDKLDVVCEDDFLRPYRSRRKGVWNYNYPNYPEYFIFDTVYARPLINSVTKGIDPLLASAYDELKENAYAHGQDNVYIGHRYWFWNLVATLTLDKLYEDKVLIKRENQFFRFDKIKGF